MRSSRYLPAAAGPFVLCALLEVKPAYAFCRTTTEAPPLGYNPAASGCWYEGKPIAWTAGRVPYGVSSAASKYVTLAEASRVADLAFAAWNSALCPGGPPNVQAYDVGPLDVAPDSGECTTSAACSASTHDVIVFRDQVWPYDDPVNTLALTTVTYGVNDGEIFEAYTEVNSAEHALTTVEPPQQSGAFDLQAILTHEAGHFLGLAHATDTHSIMYAYYQAGATNLTPDDVGAICSVYDPPQNSNGCSCEAVPAKGGVLPEGIGLAFALGAVLRRVRARATSGHALRLRSWFRLPRSA